MTRIRSLLTIMCRSQSGASAVEFALVSPFVITLMIGVTDLAGLAWAKMRVTAAARAGAVYALSQSYTDTTSIQAAMSNASGLAVTPYVPAPFTGCPSTTTVTPQTSTCSSGASPGTYVEVQANYTYHSLLMNNVALSSTNLVRVQ